MFTHTYTRARESIYALLGRSTGQTVSCGTAFMFVPGVLATAAHILYREAGDSSSLQERLRVVRDPDIRPGNLLETATVIAVDPAYDIALIEIEKPRSTLCLAFTTSRLVPGTAVCSIGYPFTDGSAVLAQSALPILRFQAGHLSAAYGKKDPNSDRQLWYYETDMPMYEGSSGCPGFVADAEVFGMHVAQWHNGGTEESPGQRAFAMWVPAPAIISFAKENDIEIPNTSA